jgi:hypothetical protein
MRARASAHGSAWVGKGGFTADARGYAGRTARGRGRTSPRSETAETSGADYVIANDKTRRKVKKKEY